jgi:tetratricopeptide (TPR) repeat protein
VSHGHLRIILSAAALAVACGCGPKLPLSGPQWSPRGDRVAFVRYTEERGDLYLLDPRGDGPPGLVARGAERFAFAAGGDRLYYLVPADAARRLGGSLQVLDVYAKEFEKGAPRTVLLAERGAEFEEFRPAGPGKVYLVKVRLSDLKRSLVELDPATSKVKTLPAPEGRWRLLPSGKDGKAALLTLRQTEKGTEVALAAPPEAKPSAVATLDPGLAGVEFLALDAATGTILLLAESDDAKQLVLVNRAKPGDKARVFPLPAGAAPRGGAAAAERTPVSAGFTPDGKLVRFTLVLSAGEGAEELVAESWELNPAKGSSRRTAAAAGALVGVPAWSSDGKSRLEFTAGGLALYAGRNPVPERVWPLTVRESAGAAELYLTAKQPKTALKWVTQALEEAEPTDDRSALQVIKSRALLGVGRKNDAANACLESLLRFPITDRARDDRQLAKQLEAWSEAQPEHRILLMVAEAYKHRASGNMLKAARSFKEAAAFSGDRAWAGGLLFNYANNLLAAGKGAAAGPIFRKASEIDEFPQADWAAGFCVVAYALGGRRDMAAEEALRCRDLYAKSPLAPDYKALAKSLEAADRRSRVTENVSRAGGERARLEVWPVQALHASLSPRELPVLGSRRLGLIERNTYRVVLKPAKGTQRAVLDRVPLPLSKLGFAPDGGSLAFIAGEGRGRSLYVVDLSGRSLLGDLNALLRGRTDPRTRAADYVWPPDGGLPKRVLPAEED